MYKIWATHIVINSSLINSLLIHIVINSSSCTWCFLFILFHLVVYSSNNGSYTLLQGSWTTVLLHICTTSSCRLPYNQLVSYCRKVCECSLSEDLLHASMGECTTRSIVEAEYSYYHRNTETCFFFRFTLLFDTGGNSCTCCGESIMNTTLVLIPFGSIAYSSIYN